LKTEEKQKELTKLRELNQATLDYNIALYSRQPIKGYDPTENYWKLKNLVDEHYQAGRLTLLRQWFRNFTEMFHEEGGFEYSRYIKEKTGYDVDILKSLYQRIDKVFAKGKITTDNQYRDIMSLLNNLPEAENLAENKREQLNQLVLDYETRKGLNT
jgi:hypothetical protein